MTKKSSLANRSLHRDTRQALNTGFGEGHFGTKAAYRSRFGDFEKFASSRGIYSHKHINRTLVDDYIVQLQTRIHEGTLAVSTATNRLSAVNVVLELVVGDSRYYRAPRQYFPARHYTRTSVPGGLDLSVVVDVYQHLSEQAQLEFGIFILMMRVLGLRIKEAILQDYARMLTEVPQGYVTVVEGTKNGRGRFFQRKVPIDAIFVPTLALAASLQNGRNNLIPEGIRYKTILRRFRYRYKQVRTLFGLDRPHDLRAAYACDRYETLTGFAAPVLVGKRLPSKEADHLRGWIIKWMGGASPDFGSQHP